MGTSINSKSIKIQVPRIFYGTNDGPTVDSVWRTESKKLSRATEGELFRSIWQRSNGCLEQLNYATKSAVDHFDSHGQSICCWCCVSECKPLWLWIFDLSQQGAGPVEKYTQKYGDALSSASWSIRNHYLCPFEITTNNQHAQTTRNDPWNENPYAHWIHLFPNVRYYRLNFKCFS
jgi:hypothetical protein